MFDTEEEIEIKKEKAPVTKSPDGQVNDLDPSLWRIYEEKKGLQFFTVWDTPERDPYGWSKFNVHGGSPVEIPRQCIVRFSKVGDKILDPFCGAGTTLVACAHLKREGTAIEINQKIMEIAKKNIFNPQTSIDDEDLIEWIDKQRIIYGDSTKIRDLDIQENEFDFSFAHPPYWELVKYSEEYGIAEGDLSSKTDFEDFLVGMKNIFEGVRFALKPNKFFCVLIGDDFKSKGKSIPLDYYLTKIGLEVGFEYFTKIVKITHSAVSRKGALNIAKFRSLRSNYFICNNDYVLIFKNVK